MKERLERKINELVEYILTKNVMTLNKDDYDILSIELGRIRAEESNKVMSDRYSTLLQHMFDTEVGAQGLDK